MFKICENEAMVIAIKKLLLSDQSVQVSFVGNGIHHVTLQVSESRYKL